jgi:CAAX protease family protein
MSVLGRIGARIRWQRVPIGDVRITEPGAEVTHALAFVLFYVGAAWLTGTAIRAWPLPLLGSASFTTDVWYALIFKIGLLLLAPLIWLHRRGYHAKDLMPGPGPGVSAFLVAYAAGFALNLLQGWGSDIGAAAGRFQPAELALRCFIGFLLPLLMAGIPEELVYRGILQTRLEATAGRLPAIVLTAVLFTAWHLPSRYLLASGVEGSAGDLRSVLLGTGAPVLVAGLVFGLLWDRYRSLPLLIAAHWGIDTLPTLGSLLGVDR